jgi:hypothetical protein
MSLRLRRIRVNLLKEEHLLGASFLKGVRGVSMLGGIRVLLVLL